MSRCADDVYQKLNRWHGLSTVHSVFCLKLQKYDVLRFSFQQFILCGRVWQ